MNNSDALPVTPEEEDYFRYAKPILRELLDLPATDLSAAIDAVSYPGQYLISLPKEQPARYVYTPNEDCVESLFDFIRHGDEAHADWLYKALRAFFKGRPRPEYVAGIPKVLKQCGTCQSERAGDNFCHKCGGELFTPPSGSDYPATPSVELIRSLAKEKGYAIGVHGTLERDLDVIAAPWTDDAVSATELLEHIAKGMGGRVVDPNKKPLGRFSANIQIDGWFKLIDISVCPIPPLRALLAWRIDWPDPSAGVIGNTRFCGLDDYSRKDRLVGLGGVAVELWGDPAKASSSGPPK